MAARFPSIRTAMSFWVYLLRCADHSCAPCPAMENLGKDQLRVGEESSEERSHWLAQGYIRTENNTSARTGAVAFWRGGGLYNLLPWRSACTLVRAASWQDRFAEIEP